MYGLISLIVLGIVTIAFGFAGFYNNDDDCQFATVMFAIMWIIVFVAFNIGPDKYREACISNVEKHPIKVTYVQYHPFTDNTCESCIVLPGQAKLLKNVNVISTVAYDFNPENH